MSYPFPCLSILHGSVLLYGLMPLSSVFAQTAVENIDQARQLIASDRESEGFALLESSIEQLGDVVQQGMTNADTYYQLGRACFYLGHDDEAARFLDKAIQMAPDEPTYHFLRGVVARFGDDLEVAEREFGVAKELQSSNANCWYEWGRSLVDLKKTHDAEQAFRRSIELDSTNTDALSTLAGLRMESGQVKDALALYRQAAEVDPTDSMTHSNIGQCYQNMKDYAHSLEAFRKVVELDPGNYRARAKLVQLYQALGKLEERDAARTELITSHGHGEVPIEFYCRDQFQVEGYSVMALEYFNLRGERPVRYSFHVLKSNAQTATYRITLGS